MSVPFKMRCTIKAAGIKASLFAGILYVSLGAPAVSACASDVSPTTTRKFDKSPAQTLNIKQTKNTHTSISPEIEARLIQLINQYPQYHLANNGYAVIMIKTQANNQSHNQSQNQSHNKLKAASNDSVFLYQIRLGYNRTHRFETVALLYAKNDITQLYKENTFSAEFEPVKK